MKTFLKILLAFIVGIALSACRVTEDPPQEPEPLPPEEYEELEDVDIEDVDIDHQHEIIDSLEIDPYWNTALQEDLNTVFEKVLDTCAEIEDGVDVQDVILDMMNEDIPLLSAEHMVETSVFIVCPEFESDYEAYILSRS